VGEDRLREGRIVKSISGFYDVRTADGTIVRCRARGVFKKRGIQPFVGDRVLFEAQRDEGMVAEILPRQNELLRPRIVNVDQAILVCAAVEPPLSLFQTDKMLAMMESFEVPVAIVCTKTDLPGAGPSLARLRAVYEPMEYGVYPLSVRTGCGIQDVERLLAGRISVLTGLSGVGKSTLLKRLIPEAEALTGGVSEKLRRGRQTTTHVQLYPYAGGYIADSPGFSQLTIEAEPEKLWPLFRDLRRLAPDCAFRGCLHESETGCAVRAASDSGAIEPSRYASYLQLLRELKDAKARRY
jgi:ribosome biogenesis GTPase